MRITKRGRMFSLTASSNLKDGKYELTIDYKITVKDTEDGSVAYELESKDGASSIEDLTDYIDKINDELGTEFKL